MMLVNVGCRTGNSNSAVLPRGLAWPRRNERDTETPAPAVGVLERPQLLIGFLICALVFVPLEQLIPWSAGRRGRTGPSTSYTPSPTGCRSRSPSRSRSGSSGRPCTPCSPTPCAGSCSTVVPLYAIGEAMPASWLGQIAAPFRPQARLSRSART
ncbi:hypothetical protein FRAHR75_790017 [Frankia sp. Hr75.2]|nr:hypothetical protein FRAHR75_790017 [Frankia sp. Hr75.2]